MRVTPDQVDRHGVVDGCRGDRAVDGGARAPGHLLAGGSGRSDGRFCSNGPPISGARGPIRPPVAETSSCRSRPMDAARRWRPAAIPSASSLTSMAARWRPRRSRARRFGCRCGPPASCRVRLLGASDDRGSRAIAPDAGAPGFRGAPGPAGRPRARARHLRDLHRPAETRARRGIRVGQGADGRVAGGHARHRSLPDRRLRRVGGGDRQAGRRLVLRSGGLSDGDGATRRRRSGRAAGHPEVPVAHAGRGRADPGGMLDQRARTLRGRVGHAALPAARCALCRVDRRTRLPLASVGVDSTGPGRRGGRAGVDGGRCLDLGVGARVTAAAGGSARVSGNGGGAFGPCRGSASRRVGGR